MAKYNKNPIFADDAANKLKQSQTYLVDAAAKLENAISLINANLHGTEFSMACAYISKIILLMQDEVEDTSTLLDKLTQAVNNYNNNIYDENGNKVYVKSVNYHSNTKINYSGNSGNQVNTEGTEGFKSIDEQNVENETPKTGGNYAYNYSVGKKRSGGNNNGNNSNNSNGKKVINYTTIDQVPSSTQTGHVVDYKDYKVVENATSLDSYVKFLQSKGICQASDPSYGGLCLGFAYTQAYGYFIGDTSITPENGANYRYAGKFTSVYGTKEEILTEIYNEISAGRPVILQVNGNKSGTSRHFVTVVGFKKTVTSAADLQETDLLILDSYDAKLESMNGKGSGTRFMTQGTETGNGDYPYRILKMK